MKCANCGKEFGSGTNCQNCGIDRVSGLANYSGYDGHAGSKSYDSSNYSGNTKTTVCYACSEIIPVGSTFCPVCGKKLLVTCPKCGYEFSSLYPVCSKCGTNRNQYLKEEQEREQRKKAKETEMLIEEQKEEQYRKEVQQLRDSYDSHLLQAVISIFLIGVLLFLFIYYIEILPLIGWIIIIITLGLCCPLVAASINESVIDSKMRKWKLEHPNDPRSKYIY